MHEAQLLRLKMERKFDPLKQNCPSAGPSAHAGACGPQTLGVFHFFKDSQTARLRLAPTHLLWSTYQSTLHAQGGRLGATAVPALHHHNHMMFSLAVLAVQRGLPCH